MAGEPFDVLAQVADAVGLDEGQAGVLRVLRSLSAEGRRPTNAVARSARLPVPLAAAVLGELRTRGLLDTQRPAGLTDAGRDIARALAIGDELPTLSRREELPAALLPVVAELDRIMADGPSVDLTLDQAFATPETKVRRVLAMIEAGTLPTPTLLAVGDDDLVTVAVELVQRALGVALVGRLVVVDVSEPVLAAITAAVGPHGTPLDAVLHDLRQPLPEQLRGVATAAMTDPPYTTFGARLFLARALEGLRPGPGWDVWLHFGTKPPAVAHELQTLLGELGLVVRSLQPAANAYAGAGVIGGASDAWRLEVAAPHGATHPGPVVPAYDGPLYTADLRHRPRRYRCAGCGATTLVGPAQPIPSIAALKAAGCEHCGGATFAPGTLDTEQESR